MKPGENGAFHDVIPSDTEAPSEELMAEEEMNLLDLALDETLDEREQFAVEKKYGLDGSDPWTLEEIGNRLKMTKQGARAMILRSLKKLRGKVLGE